MKKTTIMMFLATVLAILILPANAAKQINQSIPINLTVFVPCADGGAGENVDLSGNLHDMFYLTVNKNHFSLDIHDNPQGISGTGETTGDKYQGTGVTHQHMTGSFVNGQANFTFINRFDFIGQGPGNNFTVHETEHVTVNANGTVTVSFDNFTADCK